MFSIYGADTFFCENEKEFGQIKRNIALRLSLKLL